MVSDYGERVYEYTVSFTWEKRGDMSLTIEKPAELSGITASVSQGETLLEYEGARLETGPLSSDGLSPINGVGKALDYMMNGYIARYGSEELEGRGAMRLQFQEPEQAAGEGVEAILWIDKETGAMLQSELSEGGFTVLRCTYTAFTKG